MSRSTGRSATAAAAYRSGTEITDVRTGEIHNYTRRGGVESTGLILPRSAPDELLDRDSLWNAAERAENRRNSVVAREVLVAIPHELDTDQRKHLVEGFAQSLSDRYKTGVDFAIHEPSERGDERNFHAHIMMTTRRINQNGLGEKTRELDAYKSSGRLEINNIRQSWEIHANKTLKQSGITDRIDCRSLVDQGIDREPTKHIGVAGSAIDRKGQFSERAELNKHLREVNQERIAVLKELKLLHQEKREITAELSKLYSDKKSTTRDLKKSERLHEAVRDARETSNEIYKSKQTRHERYKGWHDYEIHKAIQQYHSFQELEPVKKGWFEHQHKFERRVAEFEAEKEERFQRMHEVIQEHRAPAQEDATDVAAGKAAYRYKIKKTEIQANLNSDTGGRLEENSAYLEQVQDKIAARKDLRENTQDRIESRRALLDQFEERTRNLEGKLNENTNSMTEVTMNDENEFYSEVPEDDTQAQIDQGSKTARAEFDAVQANRAENEALQHELAIREHHERLEEADQPESLEVDIEPDQGIEVENLGEGRVLPPPDYSEGRELEIEMSPEMRESINDKLEQAGIDADIAKAWERREEIWAEREQEQEVERDEDDLSV